MSRYTIGMVNGSLLDLYQEQWLGTADRAREVGANLVSFIGRQLGPNAGLEPHAAAIYDLVGAKRIDGLVIWAVAAKLFGGEERLDELRRRLGPLPIVAVEGELPGAPAVLMDDRQGVRDAVTHLIAVHGHRRIGFIRGPQHHAGASGRYAGYLDALEQHGIPLDETLVAQVPFWSLNEGAIAAERVVAARPEAIAAANDDLALGTLRTIELAGLDTPRDIAVTGFDDRISAAGTLYNAFLERATLERVPDLAPQTLPLTTVHAPFYELGARAVDLVLAQLRGEEVPSVEVLPMEVVVRRSCGCLPDAQHVEASAAGVEDDLQSMLARSDGLLPHDWPHQLVAAVDDGADAFLRVLSSLARRSFRGGEPLQSWLRVLAILRTHAGAGAPRELWVRAELVMSELVQDAHLARDLVLESRAGIIRRIGQRLIAPHDAGELAEVFAQELPTLGIPAAYVAAYAPSDPTQLDARPRAQLEVAYPDGAHGEERPAFPADMLVPGDELEREQPAGFVAMPLHFNEDQLGFVLFETGPRAGWVYQALQDALSENAELRRRADAIRESERSRTEEERVRHELELKLLESQRLESLGVLAGGVAHDFNNLLLAILGNASLAREIAQPGSDLDKLLAQVETAGERAANLTHQMLAYSGAGRSILAPLDVGQVVRDACALIARTHGGVDVTCTVAPDLPPVDADPGQLNQLVVSLLTNAAEAIAGTAGTIAVQAETVHADRRLLAQFDFGQDVPEGRYVLLSIRDDGVGMDETTRARAFDPFFTTKFTGRGLGLPAVLGITRSHSGALRLTTSPSAGATVEVLLPAT
ncbi:MAG: substrate-binding domain-containing protein [Gaiellaceae bacterium]